MVYRTTNFWKGMGKHIRYRTQTFKTYWRQNMCQNALPDQHSPAETAAGNNLTHRGY